MRIAKYGRNPNDNAKQNIIHQCGGIKGIAQYKRRNNKPKAAEYKYPKVFFHGLWFFKISHMLELFLKNWVNMFISLAEITAGRQKLLWV